MSGIKKEGLAEVMIGTTNNKVILSCTRLRAAEGGAGPEMVFLGGQHSVPGLGNPPQLLNIPFFEKLWVSRRFVPIRYSSKCPRKIRTFRTSLNFQFYCMKTWLKTTKFEFYQAEN